MTVIWPRRSLSPAQWLKRVVIRRLTRGRHYQEVLAQNQRDHIQSIFPTKTKVEVELTRKIRNGIWDEKNGGTDSYQLHLLNFFGTDR